jgi:hypothetical protein
MSNKRKYNNIEDIISIKHQKLDEDSKRVILYLNLNLTLYDVANIILKYIFDF